MPKILSKAKNFLKSHDVTRSESMYVRRTRESGDLVKVLLQIEGNKSQVEEDPDDWIVTERLSVLDSWRHGIKLYLNQLFFQHLCNECKRP